MSETDSVYLQGRWGPWPDLVECPACAGQGETYPGAKVGHWAGLMPWPEALNGETCDLCQGSGEVNPETAAEWEAAQLAALGEGEEVV